MSNIQNLSSILNTLPTKFVPNDPESFKNQVVKCNGTVTTIVAIVKDKHSKSKNSKHKYKVLNVLLDSSSDGICSLSKKEQVLLFRERRGFHPKNGGHQMALL